MKLSRRTFFLFAGLLSLVCFQTWQEVFVYAPVISAAYLAACAMALFSDRFFPESTRAFARIWWWMISAQVLWYLLRLHPAWILTWIVWDAWPGRQAGTWKERFWAAGLMAAFLAAAGLLKTTLARQIPVSAEGIPVLMMVLVVLVLACAGAFKRQDARDG